MQKKRNAIRLMEKVLVILLLVLGSCAKSSKTPSDTLVIPFESMPATLDPRFSTDAYSQWMTSLLFQSLVRINRQLEPEPEAAAKIDMPDAQTYVFSLRPNLVFHNGKPIGAEDVEWSIKNYLDPAVGSPFMAAFKKIKTIKVLDQSTIKLILDQPFAPFLVDLSLLKILPKEAGSPADPSFSKAPIGSGSFKISSFQSNELTIERLNPLERDVPKVRFLLVQDANTRFLKLKLGEVDLVQNALERQVLSEVKGTKNLTLVSEPGIIYQYLALNLRDPILKNKMVRQALAYGTDRNLIIQTLLGGYAVPTTSLLAPENTFFKKNLPQYDYNPEKAKQLLDQAGFKDPDGEGPRSRFILTYKISGGYEASDVAQAIRDQWKKIGIEVEIKAYEWGIFYKDLQTGNFQVASSRIVGISDPDIYFDLFNSSRIPPEGRNRGFYQNPKLDTLLEKGRTTTKFAERKNIYDQVQEIVAEDLPYISLWLNNNVAVFQKGITGYEMYPNGSFDFLTKLHKSQ